MKTSKLLIKTIPMVLLLNACASQPERSIELENARAAVIAAGQHPRAKQVAGAELEDAREDLQRAEAAWEARYEQDDVRHYAYLASRHADIVNERVAESEARAGIEKADAERNRVLLEVRGVEAERARTEAERRAEEARLARIQAGAAREEADELARQLEVLQAKQTPRGMVLTLGDVLFELDRAILLPGAYSALDKTGAFLEEHPERQILIEGHTDAQGSASYNRDLSRQRAEAVRDALSQRGVDRERMHTTALGEDFPVATNDTAVGRQMNRRVEIVISDQEGKFPAAASR